MNEIERTRRLADEIDVRQEKLRVLTKTSLELRQRGESLRGDATRPSDDSYPRRATILPIIHT